MLQIGIGPVWLIKRDQHQALWPVVFSGFTGSVTAGSRGSLQNIFQMMVNIAAVPFSAVRNVLGAGAIFDAPWAYVP